MCGIELRPMDSVDACSGAQVRSMMAPPLELPAAVAAVCRAVTGDTLSNECMLRHAGQSKALRRCHQDCPCTRYINSRQGSSADALEGMSQQARTQGVRRKAATATTSWRRP